ncbi:UxaA family hydrolase [Ensifer aridi]|uniref:UxaA family hydrolase n=1 Tax=Ensifer aridi TaxID=1708715 RepID=UPI000411B55E|nr:altronate dehydratase family protein [Ensifer aridi]
MAAVLRLSANDPVVIALSPLPKGSTLAPDFPVTVTTDIPAGHKVAITRIAEGDRVNRLGHPIGLASQEILPGDHVHEHNLAYSGTLANRAINTRDRVQPANEIANFLGFRRPDGRAATRNYIGVLTTVNCSARVARMIAGHFTAEVLEAYPWIDGVMALTHTSGCSISDGTPSMDMLRRTLAGYAAHPNFVGVLIVGLGCEDNQIDLLCRETGLKLGMNIRSLTIQDLGGTTASINAGIAEVEQMIALAKETRREPIPVSELVVGLQCGGSDSFSGLSANPALGAAVDILVSQGGTAILSETPEIYGAENILLQRVADEEVGRKLIDLLTWWDGYTSKEPHGFDHNASPGNRAGGLTTILEKSLGAVSKGGSSSLNAVYHYAEPVREKGLVFMDSPGFDPVSATGQVASGANLIVFTTGRGSCFGCRPSPSLKLATNTPIYNRMREDMDINCGVVIDGQMNIEEMGRVIFEQIIRTASGEKTASEILGYGDDEFAPWHINAWT